MTDSFVPDKPGYYWCRLELDGVTILEVKRSSADELYTKFVNVGQYKPFKELDWIGPVTRPDVVDGLVKALERAENLLRQCEAAAKGEDVNQPHYSGLGEAASIARAAIQRYRGKL